MADTAEVVEKPFNISTGKFEEGKAAETTTSTEEKPKTEEATTTTETSTEEKPAETTTTTEEKPKTEEAAKPAFEPGSYLKEKYGEYGVESEEDLKEMLGAQEELVGLLDASKKEIETLKANPVYRSEQEKKIAEFLKPFPPERFGEGLNTAAAIMGMDPANIPGRLAMEEAFVLTKPHLTRDEAKEMFADRYESKYKIDKDKFDNDADYEKKKRSIELQLKDEEAEARKVLVAKQAELKAKPEEKKETQAAAQPPKEAPAESLKIYSDQADKFFTGDGKNKGFDRIQYMSDDGKEVLFNLVLDKEKLADVKQFVQNYIKNPGVYDKNEKIPNFDPKELARTGLRLLHGNWIEDQIWGESKKLAAKMKAEQIAGASPDKKSGGAGEAQLGTIGQFQKLAAAEKAKRQR